MNFKETVGENIRHYRKLKGFTIKEIAEKVNITEATMQKYEVGKIGRVDVEMIQKIANAIGVLPEQLTGWTNQIPMDYSIRTVNGDEFALIEMYRTLDERTKRTVSDMVMREYEYAIKEKGITSSDTTHSA